MKRNPTLRALISLSLLIASAACHSTLPGNTKLPQWDLSKAQFLQWKADRPDYEQDHAIEASGMAADGPFLWIASEKYDHLLRVDTRTLDASTTPIDLPEYSEVEGITVDAKHGILMSDEAHATIWRIHGDHHPAAIDLSTQGIQGGKDGIEGIAATNDGSHRVFLLLERSRIAPERCVSKIFPFRWDADQLISSGEPIVLPLEDCNWRLSALEYFRGHLLGLKTRFPGTQHYRLISIDPESGNETVLLDLDELMTQAEMKGRHTNIEGFALEADGSLWIVSDNAMTRRRPSERPPEARLKTLLLEIPTIPKKGGRR